MLFLGYVSHFVGGMYILWGSIARRLYSGRLDGLAFEKTCEVAGLL